LFIIDGKGILRQITMNDLPVSPTGEAVLLPWVFASCYSRWADLWMRRYASYRHFSSQTSREKVRGGRGRR